VDLLIVTNNPERASFRQRIGAYLDFFHDNGINCEVAKLPAGSLARRKLFKQAADFDGLFVHKKRLNSLDAFWVSRYARKVIYDFDDAVMYSDKHPARPSRKRQKSFQRTIKLADMIIAGNSYLAEHAGRFCLNVNVLPTGLDTQAYRPSAEPKNNGNLRMVWIGSKSTLMYLAEIKPALEEIGSRFDNVVLRIICDDFFDLNNLEVEKCLWSQKKEVVDLATSDIGLAPLPDNRFTRGKCGFKILQYAAAGLPVVASPVGANAEYIQDGTNGFYAVDDSDWIEKISLLLKDSQLRQQMGRAGRQKVKQYDLRVIGKQVCRLIQKTLEGSADEISRKKT
jgi:glycosyltransferase involved in cell wall biosynthesis